jgi:hypothetical protein
MRNAPLSSNTWRQNEAPIGCSGGDRRAEKQLESSVAPNRGRSEIRTNSLSPEAGAACYTVTRVTVTKGVYRPHITLCLAHLICVCHTPVQHIASEVRG